MYIHRDIFGNFMMSVCVNWEIASCNMGWYSMVNTHVESRTIATSIPVLPFQVLSHER